uniref:Putative secreted peptide n=1 Tax=Anopheles braziliensis TaxID=58242 RepID=A0A2M3ZUA9_9DIPT
MFLVFLVFLAMLPVFLVLLAPTAGFGIGGTALLRSVPWALLLLTTLLPMALRRVARRGRFGLCDCTSSGRFRPGAGTIGGS